MNETSKTQTTKRPPLAETLCSQLILDYLRKHGETSVANLGRLIRDPMGGQNSNPGTLAASSVLRSLEKRGLVRRRADVGTTHHRTMWRLSDSAPTKDQTEYEN